MTRQSVGPPSHQGGGSFSRHARGSCASKDKPPPGRKSCTKGKNSEAHGSQQPVATDEPTEVECGLKTNPDKVRQDENPRNRNTEQGTRQLAELISVGHSEQSFHILAMRERRDI